MSWHVPEEHLVAYASGVLADPEAWSVETHVAECMTCATRMGTAVQGTGLADRMAGVREEVLTRARDESRARARVGSRAVASSWARTWRLLIAAPALRLPWMAAAAFAVAGAILLSLFDGGEGRPVLLMIAPLLPLGGVAMSYGPGMDPAYELSLSTSYSGLRLLLLRTLAVLLVTIPLLLVLTAVLPSGDLPAAVWLLPALALVLITLALGSWLQPHLAAAIAGGGWVAFTFLPELVRTADASYVFGPSAQVAWAAVTILAAGLLIMRREAFDRMAD